ncbi:MAG TPA: hypothetical protein VM253_05585 [Candidatus Limnocylindrales bacterium]|nr:hypothetical protein [Candidatus Limnocylindrales bacterium]
MADGLRCAAAPTGHANPGWRDPCSRAARKEGQMDLIWIIIIVLVVLALLGYFGYGRRRGL